MHHSSLPRAQTRTNEHPMEPPPWGHYRQSCRFEQRGSTMCIAFDMERTTRATGSRLPAPLVPAAECAGSRPKPARVTVRRSIRPRCCCRIARYQSELRMSPAKRAAVRDHQTDRKPRRTATSDADGARIKSADNRLERDHRLCLVRCSREQRQRRLGKRLW